MKIGHLRADCLSKGHSRTRRARLRPAILPEGVAPEAGEAVGENAAGQELAELLLHEPGEAGAVGALGRFLEKGLEVGADNGVKDAALRVAWAVGWPREGHGLHVRPERGPRQCQKKNTRRPWGSA